MLRTEIISTCSHEAVASAALLSIGPDFHARIALLSGIHEMKPGVYAASLVRQFASEADEDAWYALGIAMARRDMPVLAGFRFILETMVGDAILGQLHGRDDTRPGRSATRMTGVRERGRVMAAPPECRDHAVF